MFGITKLFNQQAGQILPNPLVISIRQDLTGGEII